MSMQIQFWKTSRSSEKEKDALDKKQLDIDTKLGTWGRALEAEVGGLQQRAQSGQMTLRKYRMQKREFRVNNKPWWPIAINLPKKYKEESFGVNDRLQKNPDEHT